MRSASCIWWQPWGWLFLGRKPKILPVGAQCCHSPSRILRWRTLRPSTGKNSLAVHFRQTIPSYLSKHPLLSVSYNLHLLFLLKRQISDFNPKMGSPRVAKPCLKVKKNGLGILWRERILFTFSVTFLTGNYPDRYILLCSWNITACRIYVRALFHSRLC